MQTKKRTQKKRTERKLFFTVRIVITELVLDRAPVGATSSTIQREGKTTESPRSVTRDSQAHTEAWYEAEHH